MSADRLLLEEACPTLQQKLLLKLVDDPQTQLQEQDFQDFEVTYSLSSEGPVVSLKVLYPFLEEVLRNGSKALIGRVWAGLPLQISQGPTKMDITLDSSALSSDPEARRHCARALSSTRMWLLIGPLVDRLLWLREAIGNADRAAQRAAPGNAAADAAAAIGAPPPVLELRVRRLETVWIVSKPDRVLVIMSIHLDDEVDVALGRAFCVEFAETNRKPTDFSLPCNFHEPKDLPSDLRGAPPASPPNVGFLTLTLSDQCVRGAAEERLHALARPVMTFRNFFHFHLKHAKSYLHSRLRKRLDGWQQILNGARRAPRRGQEATRRLASGKAFVPPPPPAAGAA